MERSAEIIEKNLTKALKDLGVKPDPAWVARQVDLIVSAYGNKTRIFHGIEHILEVANGCDPLGVIAAYYHDIVYLHVDGALPQACDPRVAESYQRDGDTFRLIRCADLEGSRDLVNEIFGVGIDNYMGIAEGLNEYLSALVVCCEFEEVLSRDALVGLYACLYASLPFRGQTPAMFTLEARLDDLSRKKHFRADLVEAAIERAIGFSANDIGNFASRDSALFLSYTWQNIRESDPCLDHDIYFSCKTLSQALFKTIRLFEKLDPEAIFLRHRDVPEKSVYTDRITQARKNLLAGEGSLSFLLLSVGVVSAVTELTGGLLPLHSGLAVKPGAKGLPQADTTSEIGAMLLKTTPEFDCAWLDFTLRLLSLMDQKAIDQAVQHAKKYYFDEISSEQFLEQLPSQAFEYIKNYLKLSCPGRADLIDAMELSE